MTSSMRRTIISRRNYSLREETTMISSGMMTAISHSLPKRRRKRRSRSLHLTLVSQVGQLTLLLLLEMKVYKKRGLVVVLSAESL